MISKAAVPSQPRTLQLRHNFIPISIHRATGPLLLDQCCGELDPGGQYRDRSLRIHL